MAISEDRPSDKNFRWMALVKNERVLEEERTYGEVAEDWQLALDEAMFARPRIYFELPRGHDKTGRIASHALCWLLEGSNKIGYAAGVDKPNAKLLRTEIKQQADRNPRAFGDIEVYNYVVTNRKNGNTIEILSADAASKIGLKFQLLILLDLVAWKSSDLFDALMSATGKIAGIRIWVESNAGAAKRGWKWNFREYCRKSDRWHFYSSPPGKWLASWTDRDWFEEQRSILTSSGYRRLIDNQWAADDDAFLTRDQVRDIENPLISPATAKPDNVDLVAVATDLGISKAAAAVAAVGRVKGNEPARLLDLRVFPGSKRNPVSIAVVEDTIEDMRAGLGAGAVVLDPWNFRKTIQDRQAVWPITEYNFSPGNLMALTSDVFRRVVSRQFEVYPDAGPAVQNREHWNLQRELETAVVRQMSYGERVDHRRSGFTDRIIAVGMALWWIGKERLPKAPRRFNVRLIGG